MLEASILKKPAELSVEMLTIPLAPVMKSLTSLNKRSRGQMATMGQRYCKKYCSSTWNHTVEKKTTARRTCITRKLS